MSHDTIQFLSDQTGIRTTDIIDLLSSGGEDQPLEGSCGAVDARDLQSTRPHLSAIFHGHSPYDHFMSRRARFPGGGGECAHVRDVLPVLLAVTEEWRMLDPDAQERPRCQRCKRAGRSPFCLKCERVR